ncbi:MAG TPA: PH domain-containing protein [Longimicrobium sp.]|nr:PH domain-containing protein [Longimicrobium sp.]
MSLLDEVQAPPRQASVHRLDPRTVTLWRLTSALWWTFWTLSMLIPWAVWDWPLWLMAPIAALGVAWTAYVPAAQYRHFTWQVREVDVRVMHGWLTRHVTVVLHSRIQHVDTRQGPIERALGLAGVVIYTAGTVGAMVGIPGLAEREAEALRDRLAHLSGTDDAL